MTAMTEPAVLTEGRLFTAVTGDSAWRTTCTHA